MLAGPLNVGKTPFVSKEYQTMSADIKVVMQGVGDVGRHQSVGVALQKEG